MENISTTETLCIYDLNHSGWQTFTVDKNLEYSNQMVPVIAMIILFQIIGIPGNIVVIILYSTRSEMSSANMFILFLAGIDLFACAVIHPYTVYKIYNYYDQTWTVTCKLFEFLVHLNLAVSGLTLLLVAIDRYLAICKPVKFLVFDRHVVKGIVSITILSLVVSLPLIEFYGPNPHTYEFQNCVFIGYRCDFQSRYQGSVFYFAFSAFMMTGFTAEIVAMAILYKSVAIVAYRSRRSVFPLPNAHLFNKIQSSASRYDAGPTTSTLKSLKTSLGSDASPSLPIVDERGSSEVKDTALTQQLEMFSVAQGSKTVGVKACPMQPAGNDFRRNISGTLSHDVKTSTNGFRDRLKAAKMLFFITFVFFLSWMPFFILRVCYTLNAKACRMDSYTGSVVDNLINHLFYVNNAINPLLYTALNKTFRNEFSKLIKKRLRCRRQSLQI